MLAHPYQHPDAHEHTSSQRSPTLYLFVMLNFLLQKTVKADCERQSMISAGFYG